MIKSKIILSEVTENVTKIGGFFGLFYHGNNHK